MIRNKFSLSPTATMVDGREAVQFLVKVKELVEDPAAMVCSYCLQSDRLQFT